MSKLKKTFSGVYASTGVLPLVALLMIVFIQLQNNNFLSQQNISNVLRQVSVNAVVAFGMTLIIISGNIDLSIGSIIGLSSVVGCTVIVETDSVALGMLVAILVGAVCGGVNGFVIAFTGLHPFIVTLGSLTVFRGIALIFTNGELITGIPKQFFVLNTGNLGIIPYMFLIAVGVYVVFELLLTKTVYGTHLYEIGGREDAAMTAGISVKLMKVSVYAIMGALCGVAGMMLTSRIVNGQANAGANYHLMAIGASVIGGASLTGGKGKLFGTVLGVLIIGIMSNGLNLLKVGSFWQDVATGAIIILAVVLDSVNSRKKA